MDQIHKEDYNVLYVDDEQSNLNAFKNLFRKKFNIITANSGQQGLEILETQPVDLIITDQRMPEMTGIEFLKKVRAKRSNFKFILLTAFTDNDVIKEAVNDVGIYWYVNKPFDPDQMEQNIINATNAYHADNKLKESEEKFRGVFESMTDVFTRSDMNGKCVLISPSINKMIGYKPEEIIGKNLADFYADPKQRPEIINELKSSKDIINYEIDVVRKDGKTITISTNAQLYYNSNGEPLGVEGNIRDITGKKKAEAELREQEETLRTLLNAPLEVILLVNRDGIVISANKGGANSLGKSIEEIVGQNIYQSLPDGVAQLRKTYADEVFKTGKPINFEDERENQIFASSIYPVFDTEGEKVVSIAIFSSDITESKLAAAKLYESEEKFRTLVTNTEELVYMIAKDGTFLLSEGKGLSELGLKPGEVVGKSVFDLYKDFPAMLDKMEEAFNGESVILENKIGDNYFKNWYTPHLNQEGEIIGLLGLSINITEQKKAGMQIIEHQTRLKELANDLTISEEKIRKQIAVDLHDNVGQMLASMRMQMAKIIDMEENPELSIRMKNISQGLLKSIQATRAAIFDLSPPQLNEIGLVAATHDWMKEQIEQKHHIKTVISGENEEFKLDENTLLLLFRSIKELMMNTVKHAKASQLTMTFKRKDNLLEIAVEDDGVGFNYGEDFMRLKNDSYGLFSIQERILDLGGLMVVDSVIDKGTKIKLTVPLNDKRA